MPIHSRPCQVLWLVQHPFGFSCDYSRMRAGPGNSVSLLHHLGRELLGSRLTGMPCPVYCDTNFRMGADLVKIWELKSLHADMAA